MVSAVVTDEPPLFDVEESSDAPIGFDLDPWPRGGTGYEQFSLAAAPGITVLPPALADARRRLREATAALLQPVLDERDHSRATYLGIGQASVGGAARLGQSSAIADAESLIAQFDAHLQALHAYRSEVVADREGIASSELETLERELRDVETALWRVGLARRILAENVRVRRILLTDYPPGVGNHAGTASSVDMVEDLMVANGLLAETSQLLMDDLQSAPGGWAADALTMFGVRGLSTSDRLVNIRRAYTVQMRQFMDEMGKPIDFYGFSAQFHQEMANVARGDRHVFIDGVRADYARAQETELFAAIQVMDLNSQRQMHDAFHWLTAQIVDGGMSAAEARRLSRALAAGQLLPRGDGSLSPSQTFDPETSRPVISEDNADALEQAFVELAEARNIHDGSVAFEASVTSVDDDQASISAQLDALEEELAALPMPRPVRIEELEASIVPRAVEIEALIEGSATAIADAEAAAHGLQQAIDEERSVPALASEALSGLAHVDAQRLELLRLAEQRLHDNLQRLEASDETDALIERASAFEVALAAVRQADSVDEAQQAIQRLLDESDGVFDPRIFDALPVGTRMNFDLSAKITGRFWNGLLKIKAGGKYGIELYKTSEGTYDLTFKRAVSGGLGSSVRGVASVDGEYERMRLFQFEFRDAEELTLFMNQVKNPNGAAVDPETESDIYPIVEYRNTLKGEVSLNAVPIEHSGRVSAVRNFLARMGGSAKASASYAFSNYYEPWRNVDGKFTYFNPHQLDAAGKEYWTFNAQGKVGGVSIARQWVYEDARDLVRRSNAVHAYQTSTTLTVNLADFRKAIDNQLDHQAMVDEVTDALREILVGDGLEGADLEREMAQQRSAVLNQIEEAERLEREGRGGGRRVGSNAQLTILLTSRGELAGSDEGPRRPYYTSRIFVGAQLSLEARIDVGVLLAELQGSLSLQTRVFNGVDTGVYRDSSYLINHLFFSPELFLELAGPEGYHALAFTDSLVQFRTLDGRPLDAPLTAGAAVWLRDQVSTGNVRALYDLYHHPDQQMTLHGYGGTTITWDQAEAFLASEGVSQLNVQTSGRHIAAGEVARQVRLGLHFDKPNLTYARYEPAVLLSTMDDVGARVASGALSADAVTNDFLFDDMLQQIQDDELAALIAATDIDGMEIEDAIDKTNRARRSEARRGGRALRRAVDS